MPGTSRMPGAPVDRDELRRWRRAADRALAAANAQTAAGFHEWACFMPEAAQLAVKGLLHGIGAGAWAHDRHLTRAEMLAPVPPGVQPIAWTTEDLAAARARRNPIGAEADDLGIVVHGSW